MLTPIKRANIISASGLPSVAAVRSFLIRIFASAGLARGFATVAGAIRSSLQRSNISRIRSMFLSFGPNHPAAHGVLRLGFQLQGEILQRVDPQFGFLHRGTEKLMEDRTYVHNLPYFDRFDYVANLFQEHAYCRAVEQLSPAAGTSLRDLGVGQARTLFDELSRLLNHLLTMSATCLDLGSMGPIFWAFEERERLMEFYERASGARMHTALYRPHAFDWSSLTTAFLTDMARFTLRCGRSINGAVMGLANNRILKSRLASVGTISPQKVMNYGVTGIIARSAGLPVDGRFSKKQPYGAYLSLSFRSFLGIRGDNLDRFLLRIKESYEIFRIAGQLLSALVPKLGQLPLTGLPAKQQLPQTRLLESPVSAASKFSDMESLIGHFKHAVGGIACVAGLAYGAVEGPKGEVGVTIVSDGSPRPYRIKVRTPVAHNMHLVTSACSGILLSDFVMTFCSLDIVLGEIDR